MPVHRLFTTTHRGGRSGFPKKGLDAGFAGAGAEIRYIPIENCDIWSNFIISFQTIFILITNYLVISELPSTLVGKSYLMPLCSLYVLLLLEICTTRQDFQLSHTTATGLCHIRDSFIHLYSHIIVCTVISQSCRQQLQGRHSRFPIEYSWNSLPQHVMLPLSMSVFPGCLKTFLFRRSFP